MHVAHLDTAYSVVSDRLVMGKDQENEILFYMEALNHQDSEKMNSIGKMWRLLLILFCPSFEKL